MPESVLYRVPAVGERIAVRLNDELVAALRYEHPGHPHWTNHPMADRVQALLDAGHTEVPATVVLSDGHWERLPDGRRVAAVHASEWVVITCPELLGSPAIRRAFRVRDLVLDPVAL